MAWWPPAVLVFAIALSAALLLTPRAVEPRRVAGVAWPRQTTATTARPAPEPAALPDGVPITPTGSGDWQVLPGPATAAGTGARLMTYTVETEGGVDVPTFGTDVDTVLTDRRGWVGLGEVSFRRLTDPEARPDVRISLTSPETTRRLCGFTISYDSSCHLGRRHRIVVNLARWLRGAHSYDGDVAGYRRYAITHEMGHALGLGHVGCPVDGAPAPVMMQQTFGLSNTYLAQLNRAEPGNATAVRADGAVCRPNPWVM